MPRFRKKPVEIEAHVWSGGAAAATPIIDWILSNGGTATYREETPEIRAGNGEVAQSAAPEQIRVRTLEGTMTGYPPVVFIRGVQGEFYPCALDIFEQTYDKVGE